MEDYNINLNTFWDNLHKIKQPKKGEKMLEKIVITKTDKSFDKKTNLIEIKDEENHHFYITLTNNDLVRLMLLSNQLKEGETREIEKD